MDDPVLLVPIMEANRLRGEEGCQELPANRALCLFQALDRLATSGVRRFVEEARLSNLPLREVSDSALREMVRAAIKAGRLIALRKGDGGDASAKRSADLRRLVRLIEEQTRGRLSFAGRKYKLVVDVDLGKVPGRNNYEVVGREAATRVLDGLAKQSGPSGELGALLGQASAKLTPDWRPPVSEPDGLILLRGIPVAQAVAKDEAPAITPSQLAKLKDPQKKDAWIKIHLVDADKGTAIEGASLQLKLPDATTPSSHDTDKDGLVDLPDVPAGTFSLEGVDDDQAWELVAHETT